MHLAFALGWCGAFLIVYIIHSVYPLPVVLRRLAFVLIPIAIGTTVLVPRLHAQQAIKEQIPLTLEASPRIADKILLYERYGGEWHTSNREPILFTSNRAFLKNRFEKDRVYRLTPTIYNGNKRAVLASPVQLYIELPTTLEVQQPALWILTDTDAVSETYFANIPAEIPPGGGMTINETLFIKFPAPGRYTVRYFIQGRTTTGEGFDKIVRTFDLVLE